PIPVDLTIVFANPGSSQEPGCIQIYNGTITSLAYGTADASGQRSVTVTFTATDSTVVIAWGGHIASQIDWGAGNSASAISGSPYHMRLLTLDDTQLGNQDRSLKASGILPIPTALTRSASTARSPSPIWRRFQAAPAMQPARSTSRSTTTPAARIRSAPRRRQSLAPTAISTRPPRRSSSRRPAPITGLPAM